MINQGSRGMVDQLLAESFKELAAKQSLEKITIKAITDRAGVIRPTFYNHFQDKYELLEWIIKTEILDPTRPLILNGMIDQALILMFTSMEKEKDFYCKVSKTEGQNSFEDIVRKCIQDVLEDIFGNNLKREAKKSKWLTTQHLAEYYAQSMTYIFMTWLKEEMAVDAKEMASIYMYLMHHSVADVLEDDGTG
ncbi:MAG: TetR/AcrR family transcriptional regulator C-terminal domain-containing protein [Lachnospiraceae bacterium]